MRHLLTYIILAAASLLLTACHIYDDYMYGPDGEQKVRVSFVLALGSSDVPFTRAETWHPDDPTNDDNNIGYDPKILGNEFDNTILANTLQVVFYNGNTFYNKVKITSCTPIGNGNLNEYLFTGDMWVEEEDLEKEFKMMVFANIDDQINPLTNIENMSFRGVRKDRVLTVDNNKVNLFYQYVEEGQDGNQNFYSSRIDLCNIYEQNTSTTYKNPPFNQAEMHFTKGMKVTFTVTGADVQDGDSYEGRLLLADSKAEKVWLTGNFTFNGDGTYEVECNISENVYHENHLKNSVTGADVFLIDIIGTHENTGETVFKTGTTAVTIDEVLLQDHQEYIPMWGVKTVRLSDMSADADEKPVIYVLRAMAKVEVDLSDELKNKGYTISGMKLNSVNENGYCLPGGAMELNNTEALAFSNSFNENTVSFLTDFAISKREKELDEADDAYSSYLAEPLAMYVPERRNDSDASTVNVTLRRNVDGNISEINPTQPIEFKTYTDGKPTGNAYDIHRNHNYRFVITGVNADGIKYYLVNIEDLELGGRYGFEF